MRACARSATPRLRGAFTLIEILVVIAIVAILAGIAWPVVEHAKESGRRSACVSNLHQIGTASVAYLQDYDDRTVPALQGPYNDPRAPAWADSFYSYTRNGQVFQCPSNIPKMAPNPSGVFWRRGMQNAPGDREYSFGANAWPVVPPYQTPGPAGLRLGEIADVCGTALICEGGGVTPAIVAGGSYAPADIEIEVPGFRHTFGAESAINVLFCDGHAKWTRLRETVTSERNIWTAGFD